MDLARAEPLINNKPHPVACLLQLPSGQSAGLATPGTSRTSTRLRSCQPWSRCGWSWETRSALFSFSFLTEIVTQLLLVTQ